MSELYLQHHGILGQKWGVRRFQNPDGTLTTAGRKRYFEDSRYMKLNKKGQKLRNLVIESADKNKDIIDDYNKKASELRNTETNPHAKRLIDDWNRKYFDYENALNSNQKNVNLLREKCDDAYLLLKAANKHDNDKLYNEFLTKLADKTLKDLNSEYSTMGRRFVMDLIGDYYKRDID